MLGHYGTTGLMDFLGLFTGVRGRGILRSSDAGTCINGPPEARGWLLRPARGVPERRILWRYMKMQGHVYPRPRMSASDTCRLQGCYALYPSGLPDRLVPGHAQGRLCSSQRSSESRWQGGQDVPPTVQGDTRVPRTISRRKRKYQRKRRGGRAFRRSNPEVVPIARRRRTSAQPTSTSRDARRVEPLQDRGDKPKFGSRSGSAT